MSTARLSDETARPDRRVVCHRHRTGNG